MKKKPTDRIRDAIRVFLPRWTVIRGVSRHTGRALCMIAGGGIRPHNLSWVAGLWFADGYETENSGHGFIASAPVRLLRRFPECALVLNGRNPGWRLFLKNKTAFEFPVWQRTALDLSDEAMHARRKRNKGARSKARRNGLTVRASTDPVDFDFFCKRIYRPFARQQFGGEAWIFTYEQLRSVMERTGGFMLLAEKDDGVVGGMLIEIQKPLPMLYVMGTLDGEYEYVRQGVFGLLFAEAMDELRRRGFRKVSLGGSRPQPDDGRLRFKMLYGAEFETPELKTEMTVCALLPSVNEAVLEELRAVPLLCVRPDGSAGAVFFSPADADPADEIERVSQLDISALPPADLYAPRAVCDALRRESGKGSPGRINVRPVEPLVFTKNGAVGKERV